MRPQRMTRINQLLRQEVAEYLFRLVNEPDFDPARVTVTRVLTTADLRQARVLVSVRGTPDEQQRSLALIRRHRVELQGLINRHIKMKYTPHLVFELDHSIAQGDHVLSLIAEMEAEHPEWSAPPPKSGDAAGA
ncbi:MAG: ribosome-binding factor A [Kiritimatiellae bacterium]|nr:ribosome-binding factor A [Kiritimatiellia bacterium]MDW8457836.1 ribosome-binding factor A [Verrucomicrobiota bacterium]